MPDALTDAFTALQAGLGQLPPIVIVLGLLVGPTLAWIGYRLYVSPRATRSSAGGRDLYWVCRECRSANEIRDTYCYHCGLDRTAEEGPLHVVDDDAIVELAPDEPGETGRPLVPVGPGRVVPVAIPVVAEVEADVATVAGLAAGAKQARKSPTPQKSATSRKPATPRKSSSPRKPATARKKATPAAPARATESTTADLEGAWTCDRCLQPNASTDVSCRGCHRERPVVSARRPSHLTVVPDPPTKPKPRPTRTPRPTKSAPSRRDAAS